MIRRQMSVLLEMIGVIQQKLGMLIQTPSESRGFQAKAPEQVYEDTKTFVDGMRNRIEDLTKYMKDLGIARPLVNLPDFDQLVNELCNRTVYERSQLHKLDEFISESQRRIAEVAGSFGLTAPLITKADGGKFGKTETGAIWLTPERTSPYAYYQFWLNSSDADMGKFLRIFTLMPKDHIEVIEAEHAKDPGQRLAQRELARAATALLHGQEAVEQAEAAAKALFSGEIAHLPAATLAEVFASVPSSSFPKSKLAAPGVACLDLLVDTKLASSKREAREFLSAGSVSINGRKVGLEDYVTEADLLHGTTMAIRRGKKSWHVAKWE